MSQHIDNFYVLAIKNEFRDRFGPLSQSATASQWVMAACAACPGAFDHQIDPWCANYYEVSPNSDLEWREDEVAFGFRAVGSVSPTNFTGVSSQSPLRQKRSTI